MFVEIPQDANIGATGRRRRRQLGIIVIVLSVAAWVALEWSGANRAWRLLLLPLVWGGLMSLLEARAHTCVVHAALGTCEADQRRAFDGNADAVVANRVRAKRITVQSAALALAATTVALLVP
jgi:hypothetical protein